MMNEHLLAWLSTLAAICVLAGMPAWGAAAPQQSRFDTGQLFPGYELQDQHGLVHRFEPGTQLVLVAFEMATAKATNRLLAQQGESFLQAQRAVFISNIYGMPRIGRIFALRKMRRYPHRILLAQEPQDVLDLPRQDGAVTVLRLDAQARVLAVYFWDPARDGWEDMLLASTRR